MGIIPVIASVRKMAKVFDKFPPERKDEFLKWVMLTQEKGWWSSIVYRHLCHHQLKNWYEGAEFIVRHSDEPSWIAYLMYTNEYVDLEWTMKVIENAKIGDPSYAAFQLLTEHKCVEPEWTKKIIEKNVSTWGDFYEINQMVILGYASQEWNNEVKELKLKAIKNEQ